MTLRYTKRACSIYPGIHRSMLRFQLFGNSSADHVVADGADVFSIFDRPWSDCFICLKLGMAVVCSLWILIFLVVLQIWVTRLSVWNDKWYTCMLKMLFNYKCESGPEHRAMKCSFERLAVGLDDEDCLLTNSTDSDELWYPTSFMVGGPVRDHTLDNDIGE